MVVLATGDIDAAYRPEIHTHNILLVLASTMASVIPIAAVMFASSILYISSAVVTRTCAKNSNCLTPVYYRGLPPSFDCELAAGAAVSGSRAAKIE